MKMRLLFIFCLVYTSMLFPQENKLYDTETYRNRTAQFKEEPLKKNQIVFLGNSLTQGGKWDQYFPDKNTANRGISGDNTDGILARLSEITASGAAKLFILCGVNDISQDYDNDYIYNNYKKIVHRVKTESPDTKIYFQSLLPVNNSFGRYKKLTGKEKQIEQLNKKIKKLCKDEDIQFINLYPSFLISKRLLDPRYTTDGLHLIEPGYDVWVSIIRKFVEE